MRIQITFDPCYRDRTLREDFASIPLCRYGLGLEMALKSHRQLNRCSIFIAYFALGSIYNFSL